MSNIRNSYLLNLLYQILNMSTALITAPYVSRVLTPDGIGIYSYSTSVTANFLLFGTLGVATYAQREISYNQNNILVRSKIFWEVIIFRLISLAVASTVYYLMFVGSSHDEYKIVFVVNMVSFLNAFFDITWFFNGVQEFKRIITKNIVVKIATLSSVFIFVNTKNDLVLYIFINLGGILLGNLALWIDLQSYIKILDFRKLSIFRNVRAIVELLIPQIAVQVYGVLDKIMLGIMVTNSFNENGYYDQAQKIVIIPLFVITSLNVVLAPKMTLLHAEGREGELKGYIAKAFSFVFFLGIPLIFGLEAIAPNFVPVFFGKGYEKVAPLIQIFAPTVILNGLSNALGVLYLTPTKRHNLGTITVVVGALLNAVLNYLLIPRLLSIGAAISSLVAETVVAIGYIYFSRKVLELKGFYQQCLKYLLISVFMFGAVYYTGEIFGATVLGVVVQISIGLITYLTSLLIVKDTTLVGYLIGIRKRYLR